MATLPRLAPSVVAAGVLIVGMGLALATAPWRMSGASTGRQVIAVAATAAGLSLLVAGTAAYVRRPANRVGLLMAAAGGGIFVEDLAQIAHPVWHTLGLVLIHASTPLLMHAVLAFPRGRLESRAARVLVVSGYVVTFAGSAAQATLDNTAPIDLEHNRLLLWRNPPLLEVLAAMQSVSFGLLAFLVAVTAAFRAARAQTGDRPVIGLLAGGVAVAATAAILAELPAAHALSIRVLLLVTFYGAVVGFSVGLLALLARYGDGLATVSLLAQQIVPGQPLATIEALVRRALRDPTLRLGRVDEETGTCFDARNAVLPPASPPASAREDYGMVAARYWDNGFVPAQLVVAVLAVVDAAHAADRLAADAQQDLLRNLHDGAQQRLTALALRLRLLESSPAAPADLAQARREIELANAELRRLARGEAPAGLEGGLRAALSGFAGRSPIPIDLTVAGTETLPAELVTCAYFVVAEGVTNAVRHAHASRIRVACRVDGPGTTRKGANRNGADRRELVVEVGDDGSGEARAVPGGGLAGLQTRVARLGGTLTVSATGPLRLQARLPVPEA